MIEKICYIEQNKMLEFYASNKLNISSFKEQKKRTVSKSGTRNVGNYLLWAFKNCGEVKGSEVSLMDITTLYHKKAYDFNQKVNDIKEMINIMVEIKGDFSFCSLIDFNFNSNILTLGFDRKVKYRFKVNGNKIEALDQSMPYLDDYIWNLYNLYLNYAEFCKTEIRNLPSTNTNFFVNFNMLGFNAFLTDANKIFFNIDFDALTNNSNCNCVFISETHKEFVDNNYWDFLNYIFVYIDDLPTWLQKEVLISKKNDLAGIKNNFLEKAGNLLQRVKNLF